MRPVARVKPGGTLDWRTQPRVSPGLRALSSFEEIETLLVQHAMERADGHLSAAARLLRLRRGQMEYRLKKRGKDVSGG